MIYIFLAVKYVNNVKGEIMDYEFMKQINDHRIQKEIDARIAQDALREKARQEKQDKRETAIFITGLVLCVLVAGLLGG